MLDNTVWTPLAWLNALRVNAPHVGIDLMNDPVMLQMAKANISWVASTVPPLAKSEKYCLVGVGGNFLEFFAGGAKRSSIKYITQRGGGVDEVYVV